MDNNVEIDFYIQYGNFEMLKKMQKSSDPVQFKELKTIKNPKTNKKYSTRTIAESLKQLEEKELIRCKFIENAARKAYGYELTEKGKNVTNVLRETQEKLKKLDE